MTVNPHALPMHHVSYSLMLSSPAPVQEGMISGYFTDTHTQALLGLSEHNRLLNSGSYGPDKPRVAPIKFSLLANGNYNRLLPFVPHNHNFAGPLVMYERNKQWLVRRDALKTLQSVFDIALHDAQTIACRVCLSLPGYTCILAPKLLYESRGYNSNCYFPHQFQPFFTLSANRACWVQIHHVILLLSGYINLCHWLLGDSLGWREGSPIGICVDANLVNEEGLRLLCVYRFLQVLIEGDVPPQDPQEYTLEDARNALLGSRRGKEAAVVAFENPLDLSGTDKDGLVWFECNPEYDNAEFEPDEQQKMKATC
jgi:hypothetical protein